MAKYVTEFIGTFFLVLTIGLSVVLLNLAPLAIGSVLMVMVYMGVHVSGAHYNPAVSLALLVQGSMKPRDLIPYWLAQLSGAILAAVVVSLMVPASPTEPLAVPLSQPQYFGPAPGQSLNLLSPGVWLAEILFTFALMLVIFNVAVSKATKGNSYYGLAIGFTVTAGAFVVGNISGAAFNPAVGIGPNLVKGTLGGAPEALGNIVLYIVAPVVGALLAIPVFRFQEGSAIEQQDAIE